MDLHNFFIVGAAKAGTTALYYLLGQHPAVCTPVVKEPNYFSNINNRQDVVKPGNGPGDEATAWTGSLKSYNALYRLKEEHQFRLDASVSYLYSRQAARHIATYDSDSTIIIVLRDPVERAWSHYRHLVRDGRETETFEKALELEQERIEEGWEFSWHLKKMGLYSEQIQRYYDYFSPENIRILLFEDIKADITRVVFDLADFLALPPFEFNFERQRHNVSGISRSKTLSVLVNRVVGFKATINKIIPPSVTHRLMQWFRAFNTKNGELQLNDRTRKKLADYFKADIRKTSLLINRDLDHWLQ